MYCNECLSLIEGEHYVFSKETVLCKACAEEKMGAAEEDTYCDQCGESVRAGARVMTDRFGCVLCGTCIEQAKREG